MNRENTKYLYISPDVLIGISVDSYLVKKIG